MRHLTEATPENRYGVRFLRNFLQEISGNSFLRVVCLQLTCSNATKHELLTKFLTGVLNIGKFSNKAP